MYHSASNVIHHYLVEVIAVDDDEMTDLLFCALSLSSLFKKKNRTVILTVGLSEKKTDTYHRRSQMKLAVTPVNSISTIYTSQLIEVVWRDVFFWGG